MGTSPCFMILTSFLFYPNQNLAINPIPFDVIREYFSLKMVGVLNGFFCNTQDGAKFMREITASDEKFITIGRVKNEIFPNEFKFLFTSHHYRTGTFLDFTCDSSKKIMDMVSKGLFLNMTNSFLIFSQNYEESVEYFKETTLAFDSDVALLVNATIFDLYRIQNYLPIKSKGIGNSNLININNYVQNLNPRNNLEESEIKGMIVLTNLQVNGTNLEDQLLNFNLDPQLDVLSRFCYTIFKHVGMIYNFRIVFNVTNDWGYYRKSLGHWDPGTMFSAIERNEVDLGLTICRIFAERLDVSYFIPPIKKFRTCFIFKHPSTLAAYTAFAMPFSSQSWACTFAMVLLSGLCLRFIRHFNIKDNPPNEPSFPASILLILGTICQQGLYVDSLRMPTRVLSTVLEITSLLVYSYYGAEVVGFLLTPSPKTINTLDKLIESPIKMYSENLSYHRTHFTANFSEKATKAYNLAIKGSTPDKDKFINLTIGLKKVQKGGLALYGQDTNLYTVIDKTFGNSEKCALSEINILLMWSSPVVRKKSPFKELIYRGFMIVRESGLMLREERKWHAQRPVCIGQEESAAVKLEATLVAQVIYAFGFLLAIFIYVLEHKIHKLKNNKIGIETFQYVH